jgi:hypothetical protein
MTADGEFGLCNADDDDDDAGGSGSGGVAESAVITL